ncbi:MAG: four helix bundle protein [Sphingobacteriales bacterium]|nr:four helix bundle protein [Sphingobacteriales bacterium]
MHNFKDLKVWQKAIDLAVDICETMSSYPNEEKYGLVSQMKRCSVSIPSNIAEGSGRGSDKEFNHFLNISQGSVFELETQLIISNRLALLDDNSASDLIAKTSEIQKMVFSLGNKIRKA